MAEYLDISASISSLSRKIQVKSESILDFNSLIFRDPVIRKYQNFDFSSLRSLILHDLPKNKCILDKKYLLKFNSDPDKLFQMFYLHQHQLPVLPLNYYAWKDSGEINPVQYPTIMKSLQGSHGDGVAKISSQRQLRFAFATRLLWNNFFQPFLNTGEDYRVLVLGGEVLGIIKRTVAPGNYLTNISAAGTAQVVQNTPPQLGEIALKATELFGLDFAGVDIMFDQNSNPFILEVNSSPNLRDLKKQPQLMLPES